MSFQGDRIRRRGPDLSNGLVVRNHYLRLDHDPRQSYALGQIRAPDEYAFSAVVVECLLSLFIAYPTQGRKQMGIRRSWQDDLRPRCSPARFRMLILGRIRHDNPSAGYWVIIVDDDHVSRTKIQRAVTIEMNSIELTVPVYEGPCVRALFPQDPGND